MRRQALSRRSSVTDTYAPSSSARRGQALHPYGTARTVQPISSTRKHIMTLKTLLIGSTLAIASIGTFAQSTPPPTPARRTSKRASRQAKGPAP